MSKNMVSSRNCGYLLSGIWAVRRRRSGRASAIELRKGFEYHAEEFELFLKLKRR